LTDALVSGGSLKRAVALSAGAQLAARGINLALSLVATLALSRYLGPAGFGDYIFIFGFVTLLGLVSDFGITKVAIRDMARSPQDEAAILGTSILARLGLAVVCWFLAQALATAVGLRVDLRAALAIAALLCVGDALLAIGAIFHVRIAAQYEAFVSTAAQLAETVAILGLIILQANLEQLIAAGVVARLASVLLAWAIARGRFGVVPRLDLSRLPAMLRESVPVGLTLLIAVAYLKLDGVLLGVMATPTDVGLYGAAYKLIEYPLLGLTVALSPLFPLLARWYLGDRPKFMMLHRAGLDALTAVTLPLAVLAVLVGEPLLSTMFPPEFLASAGALAVLSFTLVIIAHNGWQGFGLLAAGFQRATFFYDAVGLVVNVGLNLLLIARFGFMGAAWAALLTSLFIGVCSIVAAVRLMGVAAVGARLVGTLAANGALAAVLWALLSAGLPWGVATIAALASYPVWILVFRAVRMAELQSLLPHRPRASSSASGVVGL